jgi:hypothetical protein
MLFVTEGLWSIITLDEDLIKYSKLEVYPDFIGFFIDYIEIEGYKFNNLLYVE